MNLLRSRRVRTLSRLGKGSDFCPDPRQNFERVHTFREGSQRVRTFGHGLEKGSRFCVDRGQNLEKVRTFGDGSQRVRAFG